MHSTSAGNGWNGPVSWARPAVPFLKNAYMDIQPHCHHPRCPVQWDCYVFGTRRRMDEIGKVIYDKDVKAS